MNKIFKIAGVSFLSLSAALYVSSISETLAKDIKQPSDLDDFSKVSLNTSSDVKITMGKNYSIEMVGDEERIANTLLVVSGKTLKIKNKKDNQNFDYDQRLMINIVMPDIEEMKINGSGDGEIIGVDNDELTLKINGSGDLVVSGITKQLEIGINGSGNISMDEVKGDDVDISINGSGDVSLGGGTCNALDISIRGSGDVEAKGVHCKDVNVEVAGSGDSEVYASNSLTFDSHGSGNVDVYGKPKTVIDEDAKRRSKITIR